MKTGDYAYFRGDRAVKTLMLCMLVLAGCSSPQDPTPPPVQDAGTCYPADPGVRLMCETACGIAYRDYQRFGGLDAGLYFDYAACLNECGCNEWPDAGK